MSISLSQISGYQSAIIGYPFSYDPEDIIAALFPYIKDPKGLNYIIAERTEGLVYDDPKVVTRSYENIEGVRGASVIVFDSLRNVNALELLISIQKTHTILPKIYILATLGVTRSDLELGSALGASFLTTSFIGDTSDLQFQFHAYDSSDLLTNVLVAAGNQVVFAEGDLTLPPREEEILIIHQVPLVRCVVSNVEHIHVYRREIIADDVLSLLDRFFKKECQTRRGLITTLHTYGNLSPLLSEIFNVYISLLSGVPITL